MKSSKLFGSCALLACFSTFTVTLAAAPLGTAFTYQGRLQDGAQPAQGTYDFRVAIYDAATNGNLLGGPLTNAAISVSNGLFTVALDFGASVFNWEARWLEIGVRTNGSPAEFALLAPRQPLTPAPFALYAPNAGAAALANRVTAGSVTSASLGAGAVTSAAIAPGAVTPVHLPTNVAYLEDVWKLGGNVGTSPGKHFLGTTDNQPLSFRVGNTVGLRIEPPALGVTPNVVGGRDNNSIATYGSVIGGGSGQSILTNSYSSIIGGGAANQIQSNSYFSTIAGGTYNEIAAGSPAGTIGGGQLNELGPGSHAATVAGGFFNVIQADATYATIAGGHGNTVESNAHGSTLSGGYNNTIRSNAYYAALGGGYGNTNAGAYSAIPGGYQNTASGRSSLAAGTQAKAIHDGAFVWADRTYQDFASTRTNQFLIRAGAGVGINKNNPTTALDVNGTVTATGFSGPGGGLTGISTSALADNSVNAAKLATDAGGLAKVTGGAMSSSGTSLSLSVNQYLNDQDIHLRNDSFHGLGWYGGGKLFAGQNVNGPALYGNGGGALGSVGAATNIALSWDSSRNVTVAGALNVSGPVQFGANSFLNEHDLLLRSNDPNHGVGWYGGGKPFGGLAPDGPVVYGWTGGGLGSSNPTNRLALGWDNSGKVFTDPAGQNDGSLTPGLAFGRASGEGLSSKRTAGGNQYGLDFYTGFANRMSITSDGNVGIGTNAPTARLEVADDARVRGLLRLGSETGTAETPPLTGLVVRPLYSASTTAGSDVARAGLVTLERDGTSGGFQVRTLTIAMNPRHYVVALMGLTSSGTQVNVYKTIPTQSASHTEVLFTDAQNVVHFHGSFGLPGSHMTQVMLTRAAGTNVWVGTITSTDNQ